jgi:hypothetical protein
MDDLKPISSFESMLVDALPALSLAMWFAIVSLGAWISSRGFWTTRKWGYLLFAIYFLVSIASLARNQVHRMHAQSQREGAVPVVVQSVPLPFLPGLLVAAVWLLRRRETKFAG